MMRLMMAAAALSLGLTAAQAADSVAAFYKGKTIRIVVGVAAGSGYDLNARTLARYLQKHIPGNPNIIVQNQPGAGGVVSANSLYNAGPFDGTAIGAAFGGVPTAPLLTPDGVRYDPVKLQWLGSTNRETHVTYLWHTSPVKTWDDLLTHETVVGAQAPGSTQYDFPMLANAIFHTKFKVVTGYNGTPAINLAMERGEIEGNGATAYTTLKAIAGKQLDEKKIRIIAQWALRPNPELPDVPSVFEMAKNPDDKAALTLAMARLDFGRPFFLPPKVPADRVAALRKAFDDTMKDPEFLAEAKKEKLDIDPVDGKAMDDLVAKVIATPKPVVERVRAILDAKNKK